MIRVRRPRLPTRFLVAALLALCLGVRLLTPAGFMPSFAGGSLAIVPCPDAEGATPVPPPPMAMAHMHGMAMPGMVMTEPVHDHGKKGFHQSCPYAAAASLTGLDAAGNVVVLLALLAILPPLTRALRAFGRRATRDRPPSQGPPLPA